MPLARSSAPTNSRALSEVRLSCTSPRGRKDGKYGIINEYESLPIESVIIVKGTLVGAFSDQDI